RDRGGALVTTLDFEEPELAGAPVVALDVVAELLVLAVDGVEAELPLDLHHDRPGTRRDGLRVHDRGRRRDRTPRHGRNEPCRYDDEAAQCDGRKRGELRFQVELLHALL